MKLKRTIHKTFHNIMEHDVPKSAAALTYNLLFALFPLPWLVVSIGFSAYVENVADYSVIYGTLGAVIVLLVWLYLTSFVLILGAEFNAALSDLYGDSLFERTNASLC